MARELQGTTSLALMRVRAGLSQAAAAEKLERSEQWLRNAEHGRCDISVETAMAMAKQYSTKAHPVTVVDVIEAHAQTRRLAQRRKERVA